MEKLICQRSLINITLTILVSVLIVSGCNRKKYYDDIKEVEKSVDSKTNNNTKEFEDYIYNAEGAQKLCASGTVISKDGYYVVIGNILNKYDIKKGILAPLCSKANCNHNDKYCDAYVYDDGKSANCYGYKILGYDDFLYCVEIDDGTYTLYKYDMNFMNKEKIIEMASFNNDYSKVLDPDKAFMIQGDYLYYVIGILNPENIIENDYVSRYRWYRMNLKNGYVRELLFEGEFPGDAAMAMGDSIGFTICSNDENIFLLHGSWIRAYSKSQDKEWAEIVKYSISKNKCEQLYSYRGSRDNFMLFAFGGIISFQEYGCIPYVTEDDRLIFQTMDYSGDGNARIKKNIVIYNSRDNTWANLYKTEYSEMSEFRCDGNNIFFFELDFKTGTLNSTGYLTILSMDGSVKLRKELKYDSDYYEEKKNRLQWLKENAPYENDTLRFDILPGYIDIICADSRYFIVRSYSNGYDSLSTDLKVNETRIKENLEKIYPTGIGIIKKSDLLSGDELNIKQIYSYE